MLKACALWGVLAVACAPDATSTDPAPALAADVRIDRVVLAQSTGVVLAEQGAPRLDRDAPVVAQRSAALKVSLRSGGAAPRDVRLVVASVDGADQVAVVAEATVAVGDDVDATLWLPAEAIQPGVALAVSAVEADGQPRSGDTDGARMPAGTAFLDLDARALPPLQVVLVPLTVEGEGPDLTADTIATYQDALLAWFPTPSVEIDVHPEALERDRSLRDVEDLAEAVFALGQRRLDDGADPGVIYFGVYDAATTAGLAGASDFSPELRAAAGPSGADPRSVKVMAHEIGHLMGAMHTPSCNAGFTDPAYPHPDGAVGVETLDPETGDWLPAETPDLMGYCVDVAVSPYTTVQLARGLAWWEAR